MWSGLGWLRDNGDAAAVFADCGSEDQSSSISGGSARPRVTTPIAAVKPNISSPVCRTQSNLDGRLEELTRIEQERNKSEALAAQLAELRVARDGQQRLSGVRSRRRRSQAAPGSRLPSRAVEELEAAFVAARNVTQRRRQRPNGWSGARLS